MTFNWLEPLKQQFKNRNGSRRRRSKGRSTVTAGEICEHRTLLSGTGMDMSGGDVSGDSSQHSIHAAHPAAMSLISAEQATNTVVASGNWSDPAVWQNGTLPTDGARIIVPEGTTLTVDSVISHEFKTIGIHGTLRFATDVNTELRVDTIVSAPSGCFEMGTAANPIASDVTSRVVFADDGVIDRSWDPEQLSRGAILQGQTQIHGAETTHQVTLASHPVAGDTSLSLASVPTGWNVGDEVLVTGTNGPTSDEVRTIAEIDGTNVTLNAALNQDHVPPKSDLNVYVANTTRNVQFTSENSATAHRGHVMFMHTNNVDVNNASFTDLGRTDKKIPLDDLSFNFDDSIVGNLTSAGTVFTTTPGARNNVRGRYPVHFHRGGTNPGSTPAVINGSAVVGSPGYGLVNHSSNVVMTNNVSYDIHGSAFYTEAGDEIGTIENNIAIRTVNPEFRLEDNGEISVDLRAEQQDFGVDGDGFWLSGHLVSMKNNIASGASGHGIIIWSDGLVEADRGRTTVRTADVANGHLIEGRDTIPTWWAPLAEISNNEASNATIGFRARYIHSSIYLGEVGSPFHEPPSQAYVDTLRPEINGLTVWGSRDGALLNYNERLSLKNANLVGIGAPYVRQGGTTDLGVGIDMYNDVSRGPGVVENVTVEGFNMGILAPRHNQWLMSNLNLSNTTDLFIEQATGASRTLDINNVTFGDLAGTAVAGNEAQRRNVVMKGDDAAEQPFWFLLTDTVTMNGQGLYFDEQAASHVPLTADLHGDSRAPVPTEFVGLTNQQLQDRYGTSFAGEITPLDAQTVSWLSGGAVGSLADHGQTNPPLYEMRDSREGFSVVDPGNLLNFDPSQLGNGNDDEVDNTDESDEDDDEVDDTDESDEDDDEVDDTEEPDEDDDEAEDTDESDEDDDEVDDTDESDEDDDEVDDTDESDEDDDEVDDTEEPDEDDDEAEDTDESDEDGDETDDTDESDEDDGDEADDTDESDEDGDEADDTDESDEDDGDEADDTDESDEDGDEADDTDESDEGDDEAEDSDESDEGDDEAEDSDESDEGDDEAEDSDESDEDDDEADDTDESDEGDDEADDTDESDEGDDEADDTDESDEGDDEAEDSDESDEGDDEAEDSDESDEGDDEAEDTDESDDVFVVTANLTGTSESEKLQGFESDDVITGNSGPDLFPLTAGNDVITDFNPAEDMIDVGDFARESDDFAVLTSLEAIAENSTQSTVDGKTALVIDVDGDQGDSTVALLGVNIDDLNETNVFFGLDGKSIPPLDFTHIPETTVTLNDGTIASFAAHDLGVHPLPFELVSGSQTSVDVLNGDEGGEPVADPDIVDNDDDTETDGEAPEGADEVEDESDSSTSTLDVNAIAADLNRRLELRSTGNYFEDWLGLGEKWVWGSGTWYYLTPNGEFFEWNTDTDDARIAVLNSQMHAEPMLLTTASEQSSTLPDAESAVLREAVRLDTELGLRSTGNNFENWMGKQERWLWGSAGWYYITPDGMLYQWTQGTLDGTLAGELDSRFYENLGSLTTASEAESIDEVFASVATGQTVV